MNSINQYQQDAKRTARHTYSSNFSVPRRSDLANYTLGLTGESGEVGDIIKKHLFHGHPLDRDALKNELGDIMWYIANLATVLNMDLSDITDGNIQKLYERYPEGFSEKASLNRKV